jgi:hypothetical protein
VTARYIDADDGFGGTNVVVEATATVDCQNPIISNVQAANVGPFAATITFNTDELALGTVRHGTSCGSLTGEAAGAGFHAAHSIDLTGLSENSTYFYAVDAEDQAGNTATDDNGGICHSFATPDIPNYFTEQFGSDNDLDNTSLLFAPDGSFDFYAGCAEPITVLPVDPTGGTVLTFPPPMDDGFAAVTLAAGATVSIYGSSFSTFYVGTNGYITFTAGSSDYDETLAEHFALRRVAALYDDLHPGQGGSVSWKQLSGRAVVTWQNVPEYNAGNSNTFQIELGFDGTIRVSYLNIAAGDGISGLSAGGGLPSPFFEADLSASGSCCETALGPDIIRPPSPVTVCEGATATFGVLAAGSGALSYQWMKDLAPIPGETDDIYVISSVQVSDAGSYSVEVTDECDSLMSAGATLTVLTVASCDDGNPCTTDACNGFLGCVHSNNANPCEDGDLCTVNDTCGGGACTGTRITVLYADIFPPGGDGAVDVDELVCLVGGYANMDDCPEGDIEPCGGDADIDVDDLVNMVRAYAGDFACPHPCPP